MNTTPWPSQGRWRATTIPATPTRLPSAVRSSSAQTTTGRSICGRITSIGCSPSVTPVDA